MIISPFSGRNRSRISISNAQRELFELSIITIKNFSYSFKRKLLEGNIQGADKKVLAAAKSFAKIFY
jgi:hypothetical protein